MRALANFIMRGRVQAVIMALLGSWVPLLSQGALGLVTLRKGWKEGLIITLWASLPAVAALWAGDVAKVMAVAGIEVMVVAYLSSVMLRYTVSWSAALAAIVALSSFAALVAALLVEDISSQLVAFFQTMLESQAQNPPSAETELLTNWSTARAAGVIAMWISLTTFAGLALARWWQAMLFNPGGFRTEFHSLRLNASLATAALGGVVIAEFNGLEYGFWALVFGMPLLVAGIGLVHCFVAAKKLGIWPLVAFYVGLVLIAPLGLLVSLLGFTDVWIDYRKRFNLVQPK
ncbi:hypothetical protein [Teredinibacter turnerae]|uniref:hypothetical protein n=1 Tax=Teredinibacter turnerae TaxID=2426 RepID=UPI000360FC12|nr:hypothetical protein [Teredinibacter turnerae]